MREYNRVCAYIDLNQIYHNIKAIHERLSPETQVMAVVKAGGYGHGSAPIATYLETFSLIWGFGVASLEEALVLRQAGVTKPVLILGCIFPDQYREMILHDLHGTVFDVETAEQIAKTAAEMNRKAHIHIKLDTGMGRLGFQVLQEPEKITNTLEHIIALPYLKVEGIFTHFARSDEYERTFTEMQHRRFLEAVENIAHKHGLLWHCSNSAAAINYPLFSHDLVRTGVAIYGIYPSDVVKHSDVVLKPALTMTSHIIMVKEVEAGTSISYGGTFIAPHKMKIATIPVGYGDGYPRELSNCGFVLIHGKRCPIVGRICMDQFMVDVTDVSQAKEMDLVVLIGKQGDHEEISIAELSEISGRFHYEFLTGLGSRIPRIYYADGVEVERRDILS